MSPASDTRAYADQLEQDMCAVVRWLAADPDRINNVVRAHRRGSDGLCVSHDDPWPCLTYALAELAKYRIRTLIPTQRGPSE